MQIENSTVKIWGNDVSGAFRKAADQGYKSLYQFEVHSKDLEKKYITEDIRYSEKFGAIFTKLQKIEKSPCVYVFEVFSDISSNEIIEKIQSLSGKVKPSIKKRPNFDSRILYVGKVKSCIWGRMIMHLGYHTNKNGELSNSHGLQLFHWCIELDLNMRVQVYEFDEELADYMEIFEKKFAVTLNPLIGRHK